ncbi:acyl-CoA N-acyltransferase [Sporodiniella umbellata]|nr:acyl-CoA N-acyltransferase [Sporodiniella umbellata]
MTRGRKRLPSEQRAATKKIKRDDSPSEVDDTSVHEKTRRLTTPPLTDPSTVPEPNVKKVIYGHYEIDAWYHSPYPSDFGSSIDRLYICEYCLRYMNKESQLASHRAVCKDKKPPGKVIYAHDQHKIYEVDGQEHKFYCQNLCLLAKLFLDNKTLYFDVEGFKFYVLTEKHPKFKSYEICVGMFSKEKVSYDNYNLACIMTLPCYQRKGYGKLLIELSYELSKHEGKVGSPEKPLSPLGSLGYQSYWSSTLVATLLHFRGQVTIEEICKETCIHEQDVIDTLSRLDMLCYKKPKEICITEHMLQDTITRRNISIGRKLDPTLIRWR